MNNQVKRLASLYWAFANELYRCGSHSHRVNGVCWPICR